MICRRAGREVCIAPIATDLAVQPNIAMCQDRPHQVLDPLRTRDQLSYENSMTTPRLLVAIKRRMTPEPVTGRASRKPGGLQSAYRLRDAT